MVKRFHFVVDGFAAYHAKVFDHAEGNTARQTRNVFGLGDLDEGLQALADDLGEPSIEAFEHALLVRLRQLLVGLQNNRRLERIVAGGQVGNDVAAPDDFALSGELDRVGFGGGDTPRAHTQFFAKHMIGGRARRFALQILRLGFGEKLEALETAHVVVFNLDGTIIGDFGVHFVLVAQTFDKGAGAAIDEALRQAFVKRVRQLVLDRACAFLPMDGVRQPLGPVGDEGPGANVREAGREGVEVAVSVIGERDLFVQPIFWEATARAAQVLVDRGDQFSVVLG